MKTNNASVKKVLSYIPDEQLDFFAKEILVDWNVKKLSGKELFKLCLFGFLNEIELVQEFLRVFMRIIFLSVCKNSKGNLKQMESLFYF